MPAYIYINETVQDPLIQRLPEKYANLAMELGFDLYHQTNRGTGYVEPDEFVRVVNLAVNKHRFTNEDDIRAIGFGIAKWLAEVDAEFSVIFVKAFLKSWNLDPVD